MVSRKWYRAMNACDRNTECSGAQYKSLAFCDKNQQFGHVSKGHAYEHADDTGICYVVDSVNA